MSSSSWGSYPKIFSLGHRAVRDLFGRKVSIEEKVDGSQFSFGLIGGKLRIRSKGKEIAPEAPEGMFSTAVATVLRLHDEGKLRPEWTYRGEVISKCKHNVLNYGRTPVGFIILFDVNDAEESYLPYEEKKKEAERIGLEVVPEIARGMIDSPDALLALLDTESVLGGVKVEGLVIKPVTPIYGEDQKLLIGKYVSEAFKEKHSVVAYGRTPKGPMVDALIATLKTEARWQKGVQHLREQGLIQDSPQDIGILINEIKRDLIEEEGEFMKERLFKEYVGDVVRGVLSGFPEWYKKSLLERQFNAEQ